MCICAAVHLERAILFFFFVVLLHFVCVIMSYELSLGMGRRIALSLSSHASFGRRGRVVFCHRVGGDILDGWISTSNLFGKKILYIRYLKIFIRSLCFIHPPALRVSYLFPFLS